MNKSYYHALLFLPGLVITASQLQACTKNLSGFAGSKASLVEQATFSPREYCRTSGGKVSETLEKNIYLCCYPAKDKCVATDIQSSVSWITPLKQ